MGQLIEEQFLEHALLPFSQAADRLEGGNGVFAQRWRAEGDERSLWGTEIPSKVPGRDRVKITIGDLRAARRALHPNHDLVH